MIDNKILSERTKRLRGKKSFRAFAAECDVSEKSIRNLEAEKDVSLSLLRKVSSTNSVTISWLIGETDQQQTGKIEATIEPGNDRQAARIADQAKRATASNEALRLVVEWMDTYFAQHPDQAILFMVDLREQYDSFRDFMEKKREGGAVEDRLQSKVSNSDR